MNLYAKLKQQYLGGGEQAAWRQRINDLSDLNPDPDVWEVSKPQEEHIPRLIGHGTHSYLYEIGVTGLRKKDNQRKRIVKKYTWRNYAGALRGYEIIREFDPTFQFIAEVVGQVPFEPKEEKVEEGFLYLTWEGENFGKFVVSLEEHDEEIIREALCELSKLFTFLYEIHKSGFVYPDIHFGNIVRDPESHKLKLIDYESIRPKEEAESYHHLHCFRNFIDIVRVVDNNNHFEVIVEVIVDKLREITDLSQVDEIAKTWSALCDTATS